MSLLELNDVHAYYGNIHALMGVSLKVDEGEIVALIGANGAGKTTTLRSISGLLPPRRGSVLLEGKEIHHLPPHIVHKQGLGLVPEGRGVFPNLTVTENLEMGAYILDDKKQIQENLENAFTLFPRLKERAQQKGGTLSGGEQQMLATARGLMSNPKILLMDEPSMGLAPVLVDQIFDIIRELNARGTTILLVEQNALMALSIAHRGYVLQTGQIVLTDTGPNLKANDMVRKAYLGA
ncbi:MAG: ABC transporter ATP-binding protein [Geothrix sp.]|jgi:branched-chain amino acid transport system ATP-binding protein|nr:ABC transporter ATP-binding protein [Geothrix sp.]